MTIETPPQLNNWTFRRVVWVTLVLVTVAFSFWLLYRFNQVVFIVFIAIVLGTVIRPVVNWLQKRGIPRALGVILIYIVLLALLISFVLLLFPLIIDQGTAIAAEVPKYYQIMRGWLANSSNMLIARLGEFLPYTLPGLQPVQQTGEQVMASAEQMFGYVASASWTVFLTLAILLLASHWALDGSRTISTWLLLVPKEKRAGITELISAMESKLGYFIAGQGFLCLAIGLMALTAYLIIGLPNVLVLAIVAGMMEAVPMVGPLLGAIPAAVIALSISPTKLIWVIVATVIIQQLENNFLVPRVMRRAVGVNPFVSLLAIFAFTSFFGIAGALLAIPMAAIIQLILERFVFHPAALEPENTVGRDLASRLRYEAQDLAKGLRSQARVNKGGSDLRIKQIDQVMDEIETLTTDLDTLLADVPNSGTP